VQTTPAPEEICQHNLVPMPRSLPLAALRRLTASARQGTLLPTAGRALRARRESGRPPMAALSASNNKRAVLFFSSLKRTTRATAWGGRGRGWRESFESGSSGLPLAETTGRRPRQRAGCAPAHCLRGNMWFPTDTTRSRWRNGNNAATRRRWRNVSRDQLCVESRPDMQGERPAHL
jgi:hypothetical protein